MNMQQQAPKKIKICKYCRSEIDRKAKICPFCRKKQGESCLSVIIFVILVIGFWMFVANAIFNDDKSDSTATRSTVSDQDPEEETHPATESIPLGKQNALKAAKGYLDIMPFSADKLIKQLEFDGYSHEDAVYGASNCGADWNQQAAKAAKGYLDLMPFSKEKLIEQLVFDGYTQEQAAYGASAVGY